MCQYNRRKHERLSLRLDLLYQKVGDQTNPVTGRTRNISTGGILFDTVSKSLACEDVIRIELSLPSSEGVLNFRGSLMSFAKILRVSPRHDRPGSGYTVAVTFVEAPKIELKKYKHAIDTGADKNLETT